MRATCLASSSSGNSIVLTFDKDGKSTQSIMVECGLPLKEIQRRLVENNLSLSDIEAVLVTHMHQDHAKAIPDFQARMIPVYASCQTGALESYELKAGKNKCIAEDIFVFPFEVEHDAQGSLGFIIKNKRTKEKILFINDCSFVRCDLSKYEFDYVFVECNYSRQVYVVYGQAKKRLMTETNPDEISKLRIEIASYSRVIKAHMSLYGTLKLLSTLRLNNCKGIFLMHLSDRHANEYEMKTAVFEQTNVPTFVCGKYGGIK